MTKAPKKTPRTSALKRGEAASPSQAEFEEVLALIDAAKARALAAVNTTLIDLYWQLGDYITHRIAAGTWGQRTVGALAEYIQRRHPGRSGFSASNMWRMRQFFETYRGAPKLAPLVRELPWTHNLIIDLLFFNRALNALVAFELKVVGFEPEHLGKMQFYLEALDRDVKKPHERPSIGVLLCATKNNEVVEYALSRSMSPALVAEYETRLPDKKLLQTKLHEFYALAESQAETDADADISARPLARLPVAAGKRKANKKS